MVDKKEEPHTKNEANNKARKKTITSQRTNREESKYEHYYQQKWKIIDRNSEHTEKTNSEISQMRGKTKKRWKRQLLQDFF